MLSVLGSIYSFFADVRNRLYDGGVLSSFALGELTISIGNLTTGGTGKTPLVAYVASLLTDRGHRVCILTRGYGRENEKRRVLVSDGNRVLAGARVAGDEPVELAGRLVGKAIVISDADRVAAAEWARRKFGVTAFVLDDGFQHRRAKRDVDIVCVDATDPFGGGRVVPAGRLRERRTGLERANIVVITRGDLVDQTDDLRSEIGLLNKTAPVFVAAATIGRITSLAAFHAETQPTHHREGLRKSMAFCGVGNPESFFTLLRRENVDVGATRAFRDHHAYTEQDITEIESAASAAGAEVLLTTAKDAVKLVDLQFEMPCFVVEIEMTLDDVGGFAASI